MKFRTLYHIGARGIVELATLRHYSTVGRILVMDLVGFVSWLLLRDEIHALTLYDLEVARRERNIATLISSEETGLFPVIIQRYQPVRNQK